jgi:hypothetical protein
MEKYMLQNIKGKTIFERVIRKKNEMQWKQ